MNVTARNTISALLREMGETSYADLKGRTTTKIASDLMEMVAAGDVIARQPEAGMPRLFSLPTPVEAEEAVPETPAAPMGLTIYNHTGPNKPYWLADEEMVEARFGSDEIFMEADIAVDITWAMARALRVRSDHPVYKGEIDGVYVDHDRWGLIPMEEAITRP